jgi:hypothetical protein
MQSYGFGANKAKMDDRLQLNGVGFLASYQSREDLPGKWQAVFLEAGQNRPNLRVVTRD